MYIRSISSKYILGGGIKSGHAGFFYLNVFSAGIGKKKI